MPRKANTDNPNTTISVTKTLKLTTIDRLRLKSTKRKNGYENDNDTLKWILELFMVEHADKIHDPVSTY